MRWRRAALLATTSLTNLGCTYVQIAAPVTDSEVTVTTGVKQEKTDKKRDTPILDKIKDKKDPDA